MKYLILVPDGAGDDIKEGPGYKTPLAEAHMPVINGLASRGETGMVKTIPEGVPPGSDAANLSVMGYDPAVYLTGRSPLEAASIGIDMSQDDMAFRTNFITLEGDGEYEDLIIKDHSSGEISTEEADELIKAINDAFADDNIRFYTGTSYRHCMIMHKDWSDYDLTPPHDQLGKRAGDHLPRGEGSGRITDMMKKSYDILKDHPVNRARIAKGLNPANSIWIWGQGRKPALSSFSEKYGIDGTAISAVDLIKGIAICAGLDSADVEGATGTIDTNYEGKARAAIDAFKSGKDFVYLHFEGPDECSHQGDRKGKTECLERIDHRALKAVMKYLRDSGEAFSVLEVPDHRTPLSIRTHSADPVPFVIYRSNDEKPEDPSRNFSERSGAKGSFFESGFALADHFFSA